MSALAVELLRFAGGTLVSFDIDGTLEYGDPSGPIPGAFVAHARERGCLIGSASDRTLSEQRNMWAALGLEPDFVSLKHRLEEVRLSFVHERLFHIGDTHVDEHFARLAGFEFILVTDLAAVLASTPPGFGQ